MELASVRLWFIIVFVTLDQVSLCLFHYTDPGNSALTLSVCCMDHFAVTLERTNGMIQRAWSATGIVVSLMFCILVNNLEKVIKNVLIKSVYCPKWRGITSPHNDKDVT